MLKASRVHVALQSGQVDECGICDGLGDSCALLLALSASMVLSSEQVSCSVRPLMELEGCAMQGPSKAPPSQYVPSGHCCSQCVSPAH